MAAAGDRDSAYGTVISMAPSHCQSTFVLQHTPLKALDPYPVRAHSGDVEGYCAVACLGLADGREAGGITGAWLVWYDPAGNNGDGDAAWSHDPADAARFTELMACSPTAGTVRRPCPSA